MNLINRNVQILHSYTQGKIWAGDEN